MWEPNHFSYFKDSENVYLDSKAASAMKEQAKVTNPKARDFPDSLSRII
jgi:hypothetical protein